MSRTINFTLTIFVFLLLSNCGGGSTEKEESTSPAPKPEEEPVASDDPMDNKGIGPVSEIELGEIDVAMVEEGKEIYKTMCSACHKVEEKFIGPAPKGIIKRRSPEWIMNMILNPEEMVFKDPIAKKLLAEFNYAPMANQNLTEDQARKILEYFRTLE